MIRIIFFSLLTLTLSCANTRPEPANNPPQRATAAPAPESAQPTATDENADKAQQPKQQKVSRAVKKAIDKAAVNAPKPAAEVTPAAPAQPEAQAVAVEEPVQAPVITELPAAEPDTTAYPSVVPTGTRSPEIPVLLDTPASVLAQAPQTSEHKRFLPTRRRMDREINKLKFAYKGEVIMGLTASYGTLSSDDTDIMLILDNINASGTIASVKPFIGYFYRDNNCLGVRFGYNHMGGTVDNLDVDIDQANDINFNVPYFDLQSDNYSFGIFHRSYAGLDPKGRFGLFAEFELSVSTGSSKFAYESNELVKYTYSDNTQVKLSFNPGAAVYIFPNVCATLSFGLGGLQYTSTTQKDENGNKIGSRKASNMKFKLNIAAINIGMTIHLWDKKKQ